MAQSIDLGDSTFLSIHAIDGLVADELPSDANWNDYIGAHKNKVYYVGNSSSMTNAPGSWGFLVSFSWGGVTVQAFFQIGAVLHMRSHANSAWSTWKKVILS